MDKELTIIIPFLNEGVEVERTVQSILEHTKECVDIILINDGSDDGIDYAAISTKYNTKYLYNKERQGVARCRDIGVEASETEYFLLLDAHMRFYSNNWYSTLLSNLEKESNTLFCCQSKNLYNICGVIKEDFASTAYGASIDLDIESDSFLGVKWNGTNDIAQSTNDIFEIPCILGAGYACSRKYWLYLHGLRGLRLYGVDEQFISLKVWLTGGKCKLINSIELGHVYRTTDIPYQIENIDLIYNRMLVSRILLPKKYYQKYEQCIKKRNTNVYGTCLSLLKQNLLFINAERKYFQSLITRDLNVIICMNKANFCSSNISLNIEDTLANCMTNPNITHNNSLFWGKTGLSFIYMLLARKNKDTLYEKTAKILIQQVWTDCGVYTNLSFASGLLGIGFLVEFLHQQGIVYGNPDKILFDLDNRVQIVNPLKIDDESVDDGLLGIIAYVCSRVIGCVNRNKEIPFDDSFIEGLQIKYSNVVSENRISNFLTDILYSLPNLGNDNKYIITKKCFLDIISNSSYKDGIICLTIKNLLLEDILLQ